MRGLCHRSTGQWIEVDRLMFCGQSRLGKVLVGRKEYVLFFSCVGSRNQYLCITIRTGIHVMYCSQVTYTPCFPASLPLQRNLTVEMVSPFWWRGFQRSPALFFSLLLRPRGKCDKPSLDLPNLSNISSTCCLPCLALVTLLATTHRFSYCSIFDHVGPTMSAE